MRMEMWKDVECSMQHAPNTKLLSKARVTRLEERKWQATNLQMPHISILPIFHLNPFICSFRSWNCLNVDWSKPNPETRKALSRGNCRCELIKSSPYLAWWNCGIGGCVLPWHVQLHHKQTSDSKLQQWRFLLALLSYEVLWLFLKFKPKVECAECAWGPGAAKLTSEPHKLFVKVALWQAVPTTPRHQDQPTVPTCNVTINWVQITSV